MLRADPISQSCSANVSTGGSAEAPNCEDAVVVNTKRTHVTSGCGVQQLAGECLDGHLRKQLRMTGCALTGH
jgi:hypothetical protein